MQLQLRPTSTCIIKAMHRKALEKDETYALRASSEAYARHLTGENDALSSENTLL